MSEEKKTDQTTTVASDAAVALLLTNGNEFRRGMQKKYGKFFLFFSAIALVFLIGFLIAGLITKESLILVYIPLAIVSLWLICGIVLLYLIPTRTLSHFTEKIMPEICKMLDPELAYFAEDGIPISDYRASGLFPVRCKSCRYCDLITGSFRGTSLSFSNFQTTCEREITGTNGKTKIMEHLLFSGIFFSCGPQENITKNILVLPIQQYQKLAEVLTDASSPVLMLKKAIDLSGIATAEFQENFVVFSDDAENAKTFLTQDRCVKLCALRKKMDAPVYVSYLPDHTYIAVGKMIDLTAHSVWSPLGHDEIKKPYTELEQILHIPEFL